MKKILCALIAFSMLLSGFTFAHAADLTADTISTVLVNNASKKVTLTASATDNVFKWTAAETGGICVVDITFTTPQFGESISRGAVFYVDDNKQAANVCSITGTGAMRKGFGLSQYENTAAVLESNTEYNFKIIVYTDTEMRDFFYKKSSDSVWTDFTTMGGRADMSDYRSYYAEATGLKSEPFKAPVRVNFYSWTLASGVTDTVTVPVNVTVTNYAKASDALASKDLFDTYYAKCKDAGIVADTLTTTEDTFAQIKSVFTAKNMTTNEAVLANAAPLADVLDVCAADYKDYKNVSTKISGAKAQAAKLVANGVYTNLSDEIKKVDLLDSLQSCENAESAAGMRIYTSGNTAYADSVFVGKGGVVFIAAYNSDKELLGTSTIDEAVFADGDTSKEKQAVLSIPQGTATLKAFTWDSLDTINPIRGNLEIGVN